MNDTPPPKWISVIADVDLRVPERNELCTLEAELADDLTADDEDRLPKRRRALELRCARQHLVGAVYRTDHGPLLVAFLPTTLTPEVLQQVRSKAPDVPEVPRSRERVGIKIADLIERWPPDRLLGGDMCPVWRCRCGRLDTPQRADLTEAVRAGRQTLSLSRSRAQRSARVT